jgi:hypothetical protein
MLKKLLTLAAAGIIGCTYASCEKEITKDVPATVTLENVYFCESENKESVCCYNKEGHLRAGGKFGLSLELKIYDPNIVLYTKSNWGGLFDKGLRVSTEKKKETSIDWSLAGPGTDYFKNNPITVEVADYLGNVTKHEFTFDEIIKEAKSFIVRKQVGGDCPNNLE